MYMYVLVIVFHVKIHVNDKAWELLSRPHIGFCPEKKPGAIDESDPQLEP